MPEPHPAAFAHRPAPVWSDTTAVILAGGLGIRLRAAVADRPKVMAEVGGRPFLAWWLDWLEAQGLRRVVLCTGYRATQISDYFGHRHGCLTLRYSVEPEPLGTAGALRHALPLIASNPFLALNGDSFCEVALATFWRAHLACRARASLVLTHVPNSARFGAVRTLPTGRVVEFLEKGVSAPGWINAGIYCLPREWINGMPRGGPASLERDWLPAWLSRGLFGFRTRGRFIDIGTPESYAQAEPVLAAASQAALA
ncbi:MAG: galactokinase [Verrucomicrobia bacterium]|nr:galactokinase [Verrucomicrobiota bacterium]